MFILGGYFGPRIVKSLYSVVFGLGIAWIISMKSLQIWISYSIVFFLMRLSHIIPKVHTMQGIPVPLEARL